MPPVETYSIILTVPIPFNSELVEERIKAAQLAAIFMRLTHNIGEVGFGDIEVDAAARDILSNYVRSAMTLTINTIDDLKAAGFNIPITLERTS